MSRYSKLALFTAVSAVLLVSGVAPALSASTKDTLTAKDIVVQAAQSVKTIEKSPQSKAFHDALDHAVAVLVVPDFYKGGLIVGGATGQGVMVSRSSAKAAWGKPAFFRLSSASLGLQAGLKESELVLVVLNPDALQKLMKDKITLGAEGGIAVAKIGAGMGAGSTSNVDADIVAFSHSEGAFAGLSIEGSVLSAEEDLNKAYYGQALTTQQIVDGRGIPRHSDAKTLRNAL